MTPERIHKLVLAEAAKSKAHKRKVGAVLMAPGNPAVGACNFHPEGKACEDAEGLTVPEVVHAEVAAINAYVREHDCFPTEGIMYVSHPPCDNCQDALDRHNIVAEVVGTFMKFDAGKLRYGLIPPSATEALAKVLTYGAKKYKPNNWKEGSIDRYVDAAMRHFEAWRGGEQNDEESGMGHLEHLLTNVAFLIELEKTKENDDGKESNDA